MSIFSPQRPQDDAKQEVGQLYDQLRPALFGYLISLGLMPQESDDVIQETFLRVYRLLVLGEKLRNPRSWIFRVARNLAHNLRVRERRLVSDHSHTGALVNVGTSSASLSASPEDLYLYNEKCERLQIALCQLTEHQYACVRLRAEGLRYREIATVLDMTVSAVSETLKRAITRLMSEI